MLFAIGPAGSGKTYTAIALAVKALKSRTVRKIILSRPAVEAGEKLGFLPGDMKEKIDPYLQPLYDALEDMIPPVKLKEYIERGTIQIAPLAFMRGRTLSDAVIILDEAQNTTTAQIKMFLTRMGFNSKMIITGDITQIDLPVSQKSGLIDAMNILRNIREISKVEFDVKDIVRHRLVQQIVEAYDTNWVGGMSDIATDKTYDTILSTCNQVGQACIIRTCTSISGNFGLCEGLDSDVRASVLQRRACWPEVYSCVSAAGVDKIDAIMMRKGKTDAGDNFYMETYGKVPSPIYGVCDTNDGVCKITEQIWGNCEYEPTEGQDNNIIQPLPSLSPQTLMWWFATNTRTSEDTPNNCAIGVARGGDTTAPGGDETPECTASSQCGNGRICQNGSCITDPDSGGNYGECQSNSGCTAGNKCIVNNGTGTCTTCRGTNVWSNSANACIGNTCTGNQIWDIGADQCRTCSYGYVPNATHTDCESANCASGTIYNPNTESCEPISCPGNGRLFTAAYGIQNCCPTGVFDDWGNCCAQARKYMTHNICVPSANSTVIHMGDGFSGAAPFFGGEPILFDMFCIDGTFQPAANPTESNPGTCNGGRRVVIAVGGNNGLYLSGASESFTLGDGTRCRPNYTSKTFSPAVCNDAVTFGSWGSWQSIVSY